MKGNLKVLAEAVTRAEGGKQQLSVAQVKEVLAKTGIVLRSMPTGLALDTLAALLTRAGKRSRT